MFHLHSSPPKLHLRSTPAPSQTHPGFNMCVKLPSWSCSTKFRSQDSCLAFIHEPSPSRSINLHLSPIEVASQFNPGPHIHISPPYKHIKVSASSRSCLTSIQVLIFASHFHPGDVSPPSMSGKMQLSYTQAPSQTHTGPLHLHPGPASPASRSKGSYIIAIPVPSHLHPNHISHSVSSRGVHLKSTNVQSQLHPKPLDLHLNPFRVVSHFHPGCVSHPPR